MFTSIRPINIKSISELNDSYRIHIKSCVQHLCFQLRAHKGLANLHLRFQGQVRGKKILPKVWIFHPEQSWKHGHSITSISKLWIKLWIIIKGGSVYKKILKIKLSWTPRLSTHLKNGPSLMVNPKDWISGLIFCHRPVFAHIPK